MIATAFAALVLFVAVQCFLVVYVADKLTPALPRITAPSVRWTPSPSRAQYA